MDITVGGDMPLEVTDGTDLELLSTLPRARVSLHALKKNDLVVIHTTILLNAPILAPPTHRLAVKQLTLVHSVADDEAGISI
ncbi:hypothetical protein C8Q79DRAFT_500662 [Trametes meyenii]|nr:hypothetical protein C8Q79DRAFT_500662 [Trametes meyenii]